MAGILNGQSPATQEMLRELLSYVGVTRSALLLSAEHGRDVGDGIWFPDGRPLMPRRSLLATCFPSQIGTVRNRRTSTAACRRASRVQEAAALAWCGRAPVRIAQPAGVSSPGFRIIFSTSAMCCSSSVICSRAYSSSQTLLSRTRSRSS